MTVRWPQGDPRDVVRSILKDRRFGEQTSGKAPEPTLWDRFWQWVGDRLHDLFAGIGRILGANNPWNVAVAIAVGVAIALALGYLVFRLVKSYARSRETAMRVRTSGTSVPLETERTAAGLRNAAREAARAGRYREAAALLFRSAVRALDEAERVSYDAARTPGEYRRLVRDPDFDRLATSAVVAIFASAEPQSDLFERMSLAYDAFFQRAAA
jgi:hypothetical protein